MSESQPLAMLRSSRPLPNRRKNREQPQLCPEPSRCLFAMCTHTLSQPSCIIDPILQKLKPLTCPSSQIQVRTPYRYVPQVPQEIIDTIVDNIQDLATFKACSLVCWAFVPASRTHIWRTVCLDMLHGMPEKLYAVLVKNPRLAMYIRDLTIYRSCDTTDWMEPGSVLPAVLNMLSHIERFSLFACWGYWCNAPQPLADAMLRIIYLPTLERLHILTGYDLPPVLIRRALALRIFSFFHCNMDPNVDPSSILTPPDDPSSLVSPEYLNLSLDGRAAKLLDYLHASNSTRLSNVRRLAINQIPNTTTSARIIPILLRAVENTLDRLDVQAHENHFTPFDPSCLKHLRTFQFHLILEEQLVTVPAFLPRVLNKLRKTNPLLESLTIVLKIPHISVQGADVPCPGKAARLLLLIDALLGATATDGTGFNNLREVVWEIIPEASPPMLVPDYPKFFRENLPRTEARGILRVEQGFRLWGAAVMPHLPYTSVWPHRHQKK